MLFIILYDMLWDKLVFETLVTSEVISMFCTVICEKFKLLNIW